MTPEQLDKFGRLQTRIYRLRALLGDQTSPPQTIRRRKGHNRATFKQRVATLRRLEIEQRRLLEDIIQSR